MNEPTILLNSQKVVSDKPIERLTAFREHNIKQLFRSPWALRQAQDRLVEDTRAAQPFCELINFDELAKSTCRCHCEERSDAAISIYQADRICKIAALRSQ